MKSIVRIFISSALLIMAGCGHDIENSMVSLRQEVALARAETEKLRIELDALAKARAEQQSTIAGFQIALEGLRAAQEFDKAANKSRYDFAFEALKWDKNGIVNSASKNFSLIRNDYGIFPVLLDDAQPYLDGHKVSIKVGNLNSATVTGGRVSITYATREPPFPKNDQGSDPAKYLDDIKAYNAEHDTWEKKKRTIVFASDVALAPGGWTEVSGVVSPSRPDELGYLEVNLEASGLSLAAPRGK